MLNDPTGDPNKYRPYRRVRRNLPVAQHTHYQNYNALQALLSRVSSKFSYTAAYTLSKALGIRGGGQGAVGAARRRHPRLRLRRPRLRPDARPERRLQLAAADLEGSGGAEAPFSAAGS